jgi:predicted MFS family arabinose efflux permease
VLTASSFLSMFFLGIGVGVIGAASRNIGLSPYQIGLLIAAQNVGFLVSVLVAGALADSYPKTRLLSFGSLILAAAFFLFYRWEPFTLNLVLMLFVGVGIGSYEGVADALLLELHTRRGALYININHLFVTAGSLAIAVYLLFLQMNWRSSLTQSAAVVAVLALLFLGLRPPRATASAAASPGLAERFQVLRSSSVMSILLVTAICAIGLEYGMAGILTTFLMELRGFDQVTSKLGLIVLIGGTAAGRLLFGVLVRRHRLVPVLIVLFGAAALFTSLLFFLPLLPGATYPVLALCGLSFSSLLPFTIALAGLLHREIAGTAMGVIKLAIPVGGIVVPVIISLLSRFASFGAALGLLPVLGVVSCVVLATVGKVVQVRIAATVED